MALEEEEKASAKGDLKQIATFINNISSQLDRAGTLVKQQANQIKRDLKTLVGAKSQIDTAPKAHIKSASFRLEQALNEAIQAGHMFLNTCLLQPQAFANLAASLQGLSEVIMPAMRGKKADKEKIKTHLAEAARHTAALPRLITSGLKGGFLCQVHLLKAFESLLLCKIEVYKGLSNVPGALKKQLDDRGGPHFKLDEITSQFNNAVSHASNRLQFWSAFVSSLRKLPTPLQSEIASALVVTHNKKDTQGSQPLNHEEDSLEAEIIVPTSEALIEEQQTLVKFTQYIQKQQAKILNIIEAFEKQSEPQSSLAHASQAGQHFKAATLDMIMHLGAYTNVTNEFINSSYHFLQMVKSLGTTLMYLPRPLHNQEAIMGHLQTALKEFSSMLDASYRMRLQIFMSPIYLLRANQHLLLGLSEILSGIEAVPAELYQLAKDKYQQLQTQTIQITEQLNTLNNAYAQLQSWIESLAANARHYIQARKEFQSEETHEMSSKLKEAHSQLKRWLADLAENAKRSKLGDMIETLGDAPDTLKNWAGGVADNFRHSKPGEFITTAFAQSFPSPDEDEDSSKGTKKGRPKHN